MARTTADEVKEILETSLTDPQINGYIAAATLLVTEVLGESSDISSDLKAEIERWLTAHMIASTREQQLKSASAGGASVTYQGTTGLGLDATFYGQQVKLMDSTGAFAALGGKTARITAITSFE